MTLIAPNYSNYLVRGILIKHLKYSLVSYQQSVSVDNCHFTMIK